MVIKEWLSKVITKKPLPRKVIQLKWAKWLEPLPTIT
jgi:hypothetical protein